MRRSLARRLTSPASAGPRLAAEDQEIIERAGPYSMTGTPRMLALIDAVRYCERRAIPGAFAECGVWRGGSVIAMILTLQQLGVDDRDIYLYDTFEGMTEPTEHDVSELDPPALETWVAAQARSAKPWDDVFSNDVLNETDVRNAVLSTGYPAGRLHFIRGPVEETIPGTMAAALALLRLDTDWYASTSHELEHLYPVLSDGGVIIIDDYGHWGGARRAVDQYFDVDAASLLLHRIDYTGRIAIKH